LRILFFDFITLVLERLTNEVNIASYSLKKASNEANTSSVLFSDTLIKTYFLIKENNFDLIELNDLLKGRIDHLKKLEAILAIEYVESPKSISLVIV
jgi:hypothetical protein